MKSCQNNKYYRSPICHLNLERVPTRKWSLGSKATLRTGASWPRRVFCRLLSDTSTTFTRKSLSRAEQSGGNERENEAETQHECRNQQINGSNRPDSLHQTAARCRSVPSPTAPGASLLSQSIPSDDNQAKSSRGDEPSRSGCLIALGLFWDASTVVASRRCSPITADP